MTDISDYGKYIFERQQAAKAQRKRARQQQVPTKEIHLTVGIAEHDFEAKVLHAQSLLASRVNVRASVDHVEGPQDTRAEAVLTRFIEAVGTAADGVMPAQRGRGELVAVLWSA